MFVRARCLFHRQDQHKDVKAACTENAYVATKRSQLLAWPEE